MDFKWYAVQFLLVPLLFVATLRFVDSRILSPRFGNLKTETEMECNPLGVDQESYYTEDGSCKCRTDNGDPRLSNSRCVSMLHVHMCMYMDVL